MILGNYRLKVNYGGFENDVASKQLRPTCKLFYRRRKTPQTSSVAQ
jgi:hypothetical protein